jgi:hypothetical protein
VNTDIISARSEASGRTPVVQEEIDSVWLYRSRPGETRPEVACWVLNTPDAAPVPDFATYHGQSAPPPLPVAHVEGAARSTRRPLVASVG